MLADRLSLKRGLGRGDLFMHPQSARNLQSCSLGVIALCVGKSSAGNPWLRGRSRLTEMAIEEWFGRIRVQSTNAQHNARSYYRAACRDLLRNRGKSKYDQQNPPSETMPALTPKEFQVASTKGYASALRLVSQCSDLTEESIQSLYESWCGSQKFCFDGEPLHLFEDDFAEEEVQADPQTSWLNPVQDVLAGSMGSRPPEEGEGGPNEDGNEKADDEMDPATVELRNVADAEQLRNLLMQADQESNSDEQPSDNPKTLREALQGVHRVQATVEDLFDSLWRLAMYLRYWYNERKIAEIAARENDQVFQTRSGRLQKWMELARTAIQENGVGFTIPNKIEYGNVVIFIANEKVQGKMIRKAHVGFTLTVWKHSKKPQVVTSPIDMQHCIAIRVIDMVPHLETEAAMFVAPKAWRCSDTSMATIVRPMSLVAVLDCATTKPFDSGLQVELTELSAQSCADLDSIPFWFPEPDPEVEKPFSTMGGVARMERKKRGRKTTTKIFPLKKKQTKSKKKKHQAKNATAEATENTVEGEAAPPKEKKTKKKVTAKKIVQPAEDVIGVPADFRKNQAGRVLIKTMMERLKDLDDSKFPNNLCFTLEGKCRLKAEKYAKITKPEEWGKAVHGHLGRVLAGLKSEPANRKQWMRLIVNICEATYGPERILTEATYWRSAWWTTHLRHSQGLLPKVWSG
eukprot:s578_g12.t1